MKQFLWSFIANYFDSPVSLLVTIWPVTTTEERYRKTILRALNLFDAEEGKPEANELVFLLALIWEYDVDRSFCLMQNR